jgi:hypothetical protein
MPTLWVTDLQTDRHWRAGPAAIQLIRCSDGTVWGTQGQNPSSIAFDPQRCWTPSWHSTPGPLFCYTPGAAVVEVVPEAGLVGPLVEAPKAGALLWLGKGDTACLFDTHEGRAVAECRLPGPILAISADPARGLVWFVLDAGSVWRASGPAAPQPWTEGFGPLERGCFVLPATGRLVGLGGDGTVVVLAPHERTVTRHEGPPPLPAGPAVDPTQDRWYFAHRHLAAYTL